jgi:hypothetical protein
MDGLLDIHAQAGDGVVVAPDRRESGAAPLPARRHFRASGGRWNPARPPPFAGAIDPELKTAAPHPLPHYLLERMGRRGGRLAGSMFVVRPSWW